MALKEKAATELHLPDLQIKGFRGIDELTIPKLGRVTLLTGKNGVGKTTVLEAVEAYAARGWDRVLSKILLNREEYSIQEGFDGDRTKAVNYVALFSERTLANAPITIGATRSHDVLSIGLNGISEDEQMSFGLYPIPEGARAITSAFATKQVSVLGLIDPFGQLIYDTLHYISPRHRVPPGIRQGDEPLKQAPYEMLGPGPIANQKLSELRDKVALSEDEDRALGALRLLYGDKIEAATIIAEEENIRPFTGVSSGRRAIVRLVNNHSPVPLKSLGEGALRFYGTALALANCRGGFLLIDEVENGIHHSVQADYWRMIIATARANDVQVLATTHSWDTVKGFSKAATEDKESEGLAYRLERTKSGRLRAVDYSEEDLAVAARADIELR